MEERIETIRFWDIASARQTWRMEDPVQRTIAQVGNSVIVGRGHQEPAAFSRDGRLFATTGAGGIVLYETASGRPRARLMGHFQDITGLAFTPDGKTLVSASSDATILIWDVTGLRTTGKLEGNADELWKLLASTDPELAGQAVWAMVAASTPSLKLLGERLKPVVASKELLQKLIVDLDDQKFAVRDKATRELAYLGTAAEDALKKKLQDRPTLEMLRRIEKLLAEIKSIPPPPEQLRLIRAVEVLERIGTAEAGECLRRLAGGNDDAYLTIHAKEALQRLFSRDAEQRSALAGQG